MPDETLSLHQFKARLNESRAQLLYTARNLSDPPTREELTEYAEAMVVLTYDADSLMALALVAIERCTDD